MSRRILSAFTSIAILVLVLLFLLWGIGLWATAPTSVPFINPTDQNMIASLQATASAAYSPNNYSILVSDCNSATTTLASSGLGINVPAAGTYHFEAVLFVDTNSTSGHKYEISGTAPVSWIRFHTNSMDDSNGVLTIHQRRVSSAGSGWGVNAGETYVYTDMKGAVSVTGPGTFLIQFAQNAGPSGISKVKAGSYLTLF